MSTSATVKLRFRPYASNEAPQWHEVKAWIVGDLAIHRPAFLCPEREGGGLSIFKDRWTVSHIPTGDSVESGLPARFWERTGKCTAKQRELAAWARAFQDACPDFFAAAATGDTDKMRALVTEARRIARGL